MSPSPSPRAQRTGLVTLLFTDLVGSTALKQQVGDRRGTALLQQYREVVRATLQRFAGGEESNTAGDSFLILFPSPSDAVKFALVLQARLRQLSAESGVALQDRVGIHIGEVVIEEPSGDQKPREVYGMQVDACARVMALAQAGQVLLTRAAFDNARQALKGEDIEGLGGADTLCWLNHGLYRLKGIEEPLEICEVGRAGLAPLSAPAGSEKAERCLSVEREPVVGWRPAVGQYVPGTRWLLERSLGEGGFGEVWLGKHQNLKERRVFKFCFRADRVRSLKREVTLFRLVKERVGDHPNIVRLLEVYFDQPPFYLEMDYVDGLDLRAWCRAQGGAGKFSLETKLEIIAQIAEALQAAHDAGVIHRDIKPGNILIAEYGVRSAESANPKSEIRNPKSIQAKLSDFGVGQVVSQEYLAGMTRAGFTQTISGETGSPQTGTQMYMAPELIAGKPASVRSDIYALGVVLFQLLVNDLDQPLATDWADAITDPLLKDDLKYCFVGNPQDRFSGAGQLAQRLRALPERRAAWAREQEKLAAHARAAYRRGLVRAGACATLVVAVVAGMGWVAWQQAQQARQALQRMRMVLAEQYFADDQPGPALTALARVIRDNRRNWAAGERIVSALMHRNFPLPVAAPLTHESPMSRILHTEFSPDGQRIVTTGQDGTARVWDARTGQPLTPPLHHDGPVRFAGFSPDSQHLATASQDKAARLWDVRTGQLIQTLLHDRPVRACRFSPDARQLLTVCEDQALLWELPTGRRLQAFGHAGQVLFALFSRDGRWVITGSVDKTAGVWEAATGRRAVGPLAHDSHVLAATSSPDSQRLVTVSWGPAAHVWALDRVTEPVGSLPHGEAVSSAQFSPDGRLILTSSWDKTLQLWDAATLQPLRGRKSTVRFNDRLADARFSQDGRRILTVTADAVVRVWEASTLQALTEGFRHETGSASMGGPAEESAAAAADWSPDGQRLLTRSAHEVCVWEVSRAPMGPQPLRQRSEQFNDSTFSPDGKRKVTKEGNVAKVFHLTGRRVITDGIRHDDTITSVVFGPDGRHVVSASEDGAVRVWEALTGQPVSEPLRHPSSARRAALSADGQRLVVELDDREKSQWSWEFPAITSPAPLWLPRLAEAVSGQRLDSQGVREPVPTRELWSLKQQLTANSSDDSSTGWVRSLFGDRTQRIGPASQSIPSNTEPSPSPNAPQPKGRLNAQQ
jgi:WD40 repeat protein/class 3 adenylate cyclase